MIVIVYGNWASLMSSTLHMGRPTAREAVTSTDLLWTTSAFPRKTLPPSTFPAISPRARTTYRRPWTRPAVNNTRTHEHTLHNAPAPLQDIFKKLKGTYYATGCECD